MKKIIALILALVMCLAMFAACSDDKEEPAKEDDLAKAKELLFTMYKDAAETTNADYTLVGQITIGDKIFAVDWTADSDTIKFTKGADKMVQVDIDDKNPEDLLYKLTATIAGDNGKTESVSFNRKVPAAIIIEEGMSYEQIVEAAYKLETGLTLDGEYTLYGKIVKVDTPYDSGYKNVTVTIQVGELTDKLMMCYRLKGEGADTIKIGDYITVKGKIKNYNGTIEFDAGCELLGLGEIKDQSELLTAAYALEKGAALPNNITLVGIVNKIDTPYDSGYKNVTVTMICGNDKDRPIMCYRLKGEGADTVAIGDTITVTGIMKNYNGTIEFDAGCTLDKLVKSTTEAPKAPADPKEIIAAAFALATDGGLPYSCSLSGTITEITTPYDAGYKNLTVTLKLDADETKTISCYRLKGDGADALKAGDKITVTGYIVNYKGAVQFNAGCTFTK